MRNAVSSDVQSKNLVPFDVTKENPFNIAFLTKVEARTTVDEESKEEKTRLVFEFVDTSGERTHLHNEWEINEGMGSMTADDVTANQDRKLAHIYNTFMGDGAHAVAVQGKYGLGAVFTKDAEGNVIPKTAGISWKDFFNSVAKSFNTANDGKPVFKNKDDKHIPFWIKLTYDKRGKLQVPLFNNFMDAYREGVKCLLDIDPRYDAVEKPSTVAAAGISVNPAVQVKSNTMPPKGFEGFKF